MSDTEIGLVYWLVGGPGMDLGTDYMWTKWNRISNVGRKRDVAMQVSIAIEVAWPVASGG
jgi:hypothetical protein